MASKKDVISTLEYFLDLINNDSVLDIKEIDKKFNFADDHLEDYVKDHLKNDEERIAEYKAAQAIIGYNKLLYIRLLLKKKKFKKAEKVLENFDKEINPITYYQSYITYLFHKKEIDGFISEVFEDILTGILDSNIWKLEHYTDLDYFEKIEKVEDKDHKFLLLIFSFLVLRFLKILNVEFDGKIERKVAHFTDVNVARLLVNGETKIRLSSTEFMNDPKEGELFFDIFGIDKHDDVLNYEQSFLSCFTFNHNSLNQFRLYGKLNEKECTGISLVVDKSFFAELTDGESDSATRSLPLFRCVYIDPVSKYLEVAKRNKFSFYQEFSNRSDSNNNDEIESLWHDYIKEIQKKEEVLKDILEDIELKLDNLNLDIYKLLQHVNKLAKPIQFLFKHFAFQEEQECRIVDIASLDEDKVIADFDSSKTFINYPLDIRESLVNVYIGKAMEKQSVCLTKEILSLNLRLKPKIRLTDNPFRNKE